MLWNTISSILRVRLLDPNNIYSCLFSIWLKKQERNNWQTRHIFLQEKRLSRETEI